jgi:hypothetical protein
MRSQLDWHASVHPIIIDEKSKRYDMANIKVLNSNQRVKKGRKKSK